MAVTRPVPIGEGPAGRDLANALAGRGIVPRISDRKSGPVAPSLALDLYRAPAVPKRPLPSVCVRMPSMPGLRAGQTWSVDRPDGWYTSL